MKPILLLISGVALGAAAAAFLVSARLHARHEAELAARTVEWQEEKALLEAALEQARTARETASALVPFRTAPTAAASTLAPSEFLARLRALKILPGPGQARLFRQAIHDLEELIAAGPAALPVLREFLARQEDADWAGAMSARSGRGGGAGDFLIPPSLRMALLEVVKQIGGPDAEKLLAENLRTTKRGVELAWLARTLQESAPDKYRDLALASARELLGRTAPGLGPVQEADRDALFGVLALFGDTTYASTAQTQLVRPDGALDRSALKYLQETLGAQSVTIAAQAYQNPLLLTNGAAKEPLVRLALNFVGADAQANQFWEQAINDPILTKNHRKNLIEDLNQDGFADPKNLTAQDLALIQNRLALIEQLAPSITDAVNLAAFKETYKDLVAMRARVARASQPVH